MDRHTVLWSGDVQDDFTKLWVGSDSSGRNRLTDIANTVDRELAVSPESLGEPLPSDPKLRVWELPGFSPPVSVAYEVLPDDRVVRVLRFRLAID